MTLEEFQEIVKELSKAGSILLADGTGTFSAISTLNILKNRVHPDDRDRIEVGVPPRGPWYVNVKAGD